MSDTNRTQRSINADTLSRDWEEDFDKENGFYQNKCNVCGAIFCGHKRRVVCRRCATEHAERVPHIAEKLPYTLTNGVTATREGLVVTPDNRDVWRIVIGHHAAYSTGDTETLWVWPDAAERLRYREGEPWCDMDGIGMYCGTEPLKNAVTRGAALHRLAAILCDDAEAFRVLYWCIHNLKGES